MSVACPPKRQNVLCRAEIGESVLHNTLVVILYAKERLIGEVAKKIPSRCARLGI